MPRWSFVSERPREADHTPKHALRLHPMDCAKLTKYTCSIAHAHRLTLGLRFAIAKGLHGNDPLAGKAEEADAAGSRRASGTYVDHDKAESLN